LRKALILGTLFLFSCGFVLLWSLRQSFFKEAPQTGTETKLSAREAESKSSQEQGVEERTDNLGPSLANIDLLNKGESLVEADTYEDFDKIELVEAALKENNTSALLWIRTAKATSGSHWQGVRLQALGTLGRAEKSDAEKNEVQKHLWQVVALASRNPSVAEVGDALIALDALAQLGHPVETEDSLSFLSAELLPWPLAEKTLRVLQALESPVLDQTKKKVRQLLTSPPNAMFREIPAPDRARIEELLNP
jgi:hypothetical protein